MCAAAGEEVTIVGDIKDTFPPLKCWRNLGVCDSCGDLQLMDEKFPRCLHHELGSNELRKFNGFCKIVKKKKMTICKRRLQQVQADVASGVATTSRDDEQSTDPDHDPRNPLLWIRSKEEARIEAIHMASIEEAVEDTTAPIVLNLPQLMPEHLWWTAEVGANEVRGRIYSAGVDAGSN